MTDTQRQYPRPLGVSEATYLREIDLWQQHERVANELRAVQRRAQEGRLCAGDAVRHQNLINQLDLVETAIAALEAEHSVEMSAELARFTADLTADIDRLAARRGAA
jgi:hypothetical protein